MRGEHNAKKVRQLDYYTGEVIETYNSIREAARDNFCDITSVQKALWSRNGVMPLKELKFEYV